jgi:hypothetical protein
VRSVYLYDDYIVIVYNFTDGGDGLRHDFAELADKAVKGQKNSEGTDSNRVPSAGPDSTLSEPAAILLITLSVFAVIIKRDSICSI